MRRFILALSLLAMLAVFTSVSVAQDAAAQAQTVHTVVPGDTLFRLSIRYNTTVAAIAQANNIANVNLIFVGQRLNIPTGGGTTPPPTTPCPPGGTGQTYTIVRGDTLASIAARFGTTYQALAQLNGIANPNLIFAGTTIRISGSGTNCPPPGPQPTTPPGATPVPPPQGGFELGGHVFAFSYPEQMRGAGMTYAKYQVVYNQGDPASIAQDEINNARNRGFKILLSIKGNPAQIAANPTQFYQNFATFLGGVAQLNPDAIEVWNEQNIDREWPAAMINGASYTQMLSAAYQAIKNANPNVLVISGAPAPTGFFGAAGCGSTGCNDDAYLRQMAQAGAGQFFDCLGIHYNEGILPPTASSGDPRGNSSHYTRYYPTMVNTYRGVFPNKPLCFTEIGYLSPEGYGPLPPAFSWAANTSAQEQAEWLAQAVTSARNSGFVRLFIVWNVDATEYGTDPQAGYAIVRGNQCLACITMGAAMGQ